MQITLPGPTQGDIPKAIPQWLLMPISSPHSVTECPSDLATGPSMAEELEELISGASLKMPRQPPAHTLPRRPPPVAPNKPMASRVEVFPEEVIPVYLKQLPTSPQESSQAGMANIMAHSSWSLSLPCWALQRGITAPLPSSHRPSPLSC